MQTIIRADSLELLRGMPDDCFDCILTDPPYKISKPDMVKTGGSKLVRDFGEDDRVLPIKDLASYFDDLLKPDGSILVWCADNQLGEWMKSLQGLFEKIVVGSWHKTNPAPSIRKRQWTQALEFWVWAARGKYTFNWLGQPIMSNVHVSPHLSASSPEKVGHPNQKPERICEHHVRVLTNECDVVLDPFCGSGSYGVSCKKLGRNFVGIEKTKKWSKIAKRRIDKASTQKELLIVGNKKKEQTSLFEV